MKSGCDRSPRDTKRYKYISSIKLNGVPILPPLITPEKRKELKRYKKEAIKIEQRLQRERDLKLYITQIYQSCSNDVNNDLNTTVEDVSKSGSNHHEEITSNNEALKKNRLNHNLTFYTQVTQFISEGTTTCNDLYGSGEHLEKQNIPKTPKLIRSNSYVLDAPSPALVDYWRNKENTCMETKLSPKSIDTPDIKEECDMQSEFLSNDVSVNNNGNTTCMNDTIINLVDDNTIVDNTLISNNMNNEKDENDIQVISIDGDDTPRSIEQFSKASCMVDKLSALNTSDELCNSSRTETELRNLSDCESNIQEFIVNNVPQSTENYSTDISNSSQLSPKSEINGILRNIPSEYSRQILDILERQQLSTAFTDDFDDIHNQPDKYSTPHGTTILGETFYLSFDNENDDTINNEQKRNFNEEEFNKSHLQQSNNKSTIDLLENNENVATETNKSKAKSPRKEKLTRSQAANVITAVAKGFLVRRLMKTEKVQNLIQTIKDAVVCAVQLHNDTLEHIDAADVELHRRLIQQVSAACYTFHDVFFATSIQDQMAFIAVDRQKKREKLRRISSANSASSIRSGKSTSSTGKPRRFLFNS